MARETTEALGDGLLVSDIGQNVVEQRKLRFFARNRNGRDLFETVIGNYSIAMGHDVKALPVTVTEQVQPPIRLNPRGTTYLRLHHQVHG